MVRRQLASGRRRDERVEAVLHHVVAMAVAMAMPVVVMMMPVPMVVVVVCSVRVAVHAGVAVRVRVHVGMLRRLQLPAHQSRLCLLPLGSQTLQILHTHPAANRLRTSARNRSRRRAPGHQRCHASDNPNPNADADATGPRRRNDVVTRSLWRRRHLKWGMRPKLLVLLLTLTERSRPRGTVRARGLGQERRGHRRTRDSTRNGVHGGVDAVL